MSYRLPGWIVEPERNRLVPDRSDHEPGDEVRLTPRAMDLLVYLLERGRRVVSKDSILRDVWDSRAVTDDALIVAVYELRKALGDDARSPRYIETVPRRGYRWIARVEQSSSDAPTIDSPVHERRAFAPRRPAVPRLVALLGLAALAWTAAAILQRDDPPPVVESQVDSQVSDPLREALLAGVRRDLEQRTAHSLDQARDALGRLAGDDPAALALAARIAASRADLRLGDRAALYHRARSLAREALALDPRQADAHLALASAYLLVDWHLDAAERALGRALALDASDPDAYQVEGWIRSIRGEHDAAVAAGRRAVALAPASATRRADLSFLFLVAGRADEAVAEAEAALVLAPEHGWARAALVRAHLARGDAASALRWMHGSPDAQEIEGMPEERFWTLVEKRLAAVPAQSAPVPHAVLAARSGDALRALDLLEIAFARRDWEILWIEHHDGLEPLHDTPRFHDLVGRRDALLSSRFPDELPTAATRTATAQTTELSRLGSAPAPR